MPSGRITIVLAYTGDVETVEEVLSEMLTNARQRALTAKLARQGSAAETIPWAEAIIINDDGNIIRHGAFHVNTEAEDADTEGIVDGRLPNEPVPFFPPGLKRKK